MARTDKTIIKNELEGSFDVDLAPMLALMVCLIPIMLMSTKFVQVKLIETPLPQVVKEALEKDRKKKDRQVNIAVHMKENKKMQVRVTKEGKVVHAENFTGRENKWDLDGLHRELVEVKKSHPKVFRLELVPSKKVPYDDIVKVMDVARKRNKDDPKLYIKDEEKNKKVETDIMFPDIFFANVMES